MISFMGEDVFGGIHILTICGLIAVYLFLKFFSKNGSPSINIFCNALPAVIFLLALIRFIYFIHAFGRESVQMDFSAYYTAAESLRLGLSPYKNYVGHVPPLWDGIAMYQHARYSYPPIVIYLFLPFSFFPYAVAKYFWMGFMILCAVSALWVSARVFSLPRKASVLMAIATLLFLFYPAQTELERGQINAVTLLLNVAAIWMMLPGDRRDFIAGMLWALSTFVKLYVVYIIPFLILRRKWKVLAGYAAGFCSIVLISSLLHGALLKDYWVNQLPRASRVGDWGTPDILTAHLRDSGTPLGSTIKDGGYYRPEYREFLTNATLVEIFWKSVPAQKFYKLLVPFGLATQGRTILGWLFLIGFLAVVWIWQRYGRGRTAGFSPEEEFIYWQAMLIPILLVGTRTESMNTIWLLPVFIIILTKLRSLGTLAPSQKISLGLCAAGLFLMGVPDYLFLPASKGTVSCLTHKYIYAEILVFAGLLGMLSGKYSRPEPYRSV